ncbi:ATP-binding cassette domain-containing protein [Aidingimonas lacisalsi]|uniref:ATP-binding cassette domain-containing protein n=1 Tax=Aidingimonas lacisalsi TaxID=2604086 RepID=UPI0011D29B0D|nr:ATP-binding cassette domain-containing protein [Aidingimonas lacisalsi]
MTSLTLNEVVADYGKGRVLGPLSLTLSPGEHVALVGKSGAGKSTLLDLMYTHWRHQNAALIPQQLGLVDTLSTFHNVYMGGLSRHSTCHNLITLARPFRRDVADISPLLERLEIADTCWNRAGELSGGQRQRVAAARVLYQAGSVLLADEPVSSLDGPQAASVMAALTDTYATAVLAMHDVELALRFCDRVIGIHQGTIALDQPSRRLTTRDVLPLYES